MPAGRPRTPLQKAKLTGADKLHPGRYKDRKEPPSKPLGGPSKELTKREVGFWHKLVKEGRSYLTEGDRTLVELACKLRAKMFTSDGLDLQEANTLIRVLSKLGMTPTDRQRVLFVTPDDDGGEDDPTAEFCN